MERDDCSILKRRRALFTRLTAERDAAVGGSAERATLDAACERCADKLAILSRQVLDSNAERHAALPAPTSSLTKALSTCVTLGKWRARLFRELTALRASAARLDDATQALRRATGQVFGDVPLMRTRVERKLVSGAARSHCASAAEALDAARAASAYARRLVPEDAPRQLRTAGSARSAACSAQPQVAHAARCLQDVVTACRDELIALGAAHAQLDCAVLKAREMAASGSRCDSMLQLPTLKKALCLLITLT